MRLGGTCRKCFLLAFSRVHPADGSYDAAVGEKDSDNTTPHHTANECECHYLIDGRIRAGQSQQRWNVTEKVVDDI